MIVIRNGVIEIPPEDAERYRHTCPECGAMGFGNATCRHCVSQWPRFGISQATVDKPLSVLKPEHFLPPIGTVRQ